jgi:hypothetical protein
VLLEKRQRGIGPPLLKCPERNIEDQQRRDERSFDSFSDDQLEHDRCFEHPRHRRPEVPGDPLDDMLLILADFVAAVLRKLPSRLLRGKP